METLFFHGYLAAVMRSARIAANMTQAQLANQAGVTRRFIQSLENGKQETSISTLFALADALGIPPSKLITDLECAVAKRELPDALKANLPPHRPGRPKSKT